MPTIEANLVARVGARVEALSSQTYSSQTYSSQAEEAISYTKPQARFSVKWGMQHLYRTGRQTKEETSARKSPG